MRCRAIAKGLGSSRRGRCPQLRGGRVHPARGGVCALARAREVLEFQDDALVRIRELPIDWVQCGARRDTVVRRGDSKSVVIARCGAPEHSTVLGVAGGRRIEEWRYRLVRNGRRSTYTGTFLDDSLGFIEVFRDRRR